MSYLTRHITYTVSLKRKLSGLAKRYKPGLSRWGFLGIVFLIGCWGGANAQAAPETQAVKVIELFTSHGCSSCPPAEKLFHQLLEDDPTLIGLEYHVDYWNSLIHGSDGNFVDPFSKAEYSLRQRIYNQSHLNGRPGVYTPQAVINGSYAAVGSSKRHISYALSRVQPSLIDIEFEWLDAEKSRLAVTLSPNDSATATVAGFDVNLVRFLDSAITEITGGENRHRTLRNTNIVFEKKVIGRVQADGQSRFEIEPANPDEGCAIIVQTESFTPVLAAALCP